MTNQPKTEALRALIDAHAQQLRLPAVRSNFRDLADQALREQQTPDAYLAALLELEITERTERRQRRRLGEARFPIIKTLQEFCFADNPTIPRATIATLAQGDWIKNNESIILLGDSGTGKTHLATALGAEPVNPCETVVR